MVVKSVFLPIICVLLFELFGKESFLSPLVLGSIVVCLHGQLFEEVTEIVDSVKYLV